MGQSTLETTASYRLYLHAHMLLTDGAHQSNDSIAGEADPEFFAVDAWDIDDLIMTLA